jgi:hypothetical protein
MEHGRNISDIATLHTYIRIRKQAGIFFLS